MAGLGSRLICDKEILGGWSSLNKALPSGVSSSWLTWQVSRRSDSATASCVCRMQGMSAEQALFLTAPETWSSFGKLKDARTHTMKSVYWHHGKGGVKVLCAKGCNWLYMLCNFQLCWILCICPIFPYSRFRGIVAFQGPPPSFFAQEKDGAPSLDLHSCTRKRIWAGCLIKPWSVLSSTKCTNVQRRKHISKDFTKCALHGALRGHCTHWKSESVVRLHRGIWILSYCLWKYVHGSTHEKHGHAAPIF